MPDESPENCPDPKSNDTSKKKRLKKIRPAWLSDVVAGYVCISFATPIWVVGGSLLNSRPKPILLAWGLIFAGFCFFAFAVEFWVVNHRKRQTDNKIPLSLTTWLRFGIILAALGVSVFAIRHEEKDNPEPNPIPTKDPKFAVSLITSDSPFKLELTNNFLQFFDRFPSSRTQMTGNVIIPIKSFENLPRLQFTVKSDMPCDPVMVSFVADKQLDFDGWDGFRRGEHDEIYFKSVWAITRSLFPRIGDPLPDITLKPCACISNRIAAACWLQIMPKNRHDSILAFWLVVPVTTNITQPHVILATNGVFFIPEKD